jgi:hypothetical protein
MATLATLAAVALGGCNADTTPAPSQAPPLPGPTPIVTVYELGTTIWSEGFVLTFHTAIASLDPKGGTVTALVRIDNPGPDPATFDAPLRLTASGTVFQLVHGTELPLIDGGGAAELRLDFDVVGRGTIDDGVIRVGRSADHAAQIPFRTGPVATLTLEPKAANLAGAVTAGSYHVVLRTRVVRWDLPDWYLELPLSTEALTLTYDVTDVGTFAGGVPFTSDVVGLRLPNGSTVRPRADGHSQSIVVIAPHQTVKNLFSRFEIPSGLSGAFAFIVRDGSTTKTIPFTLAP